MHRNSWIHGYWERAKAKLEFKLCLMLASIYREFPSKISTVDQISAEFVCRNRGRIIHHSLAKWTSQTIDDSRNDVNSSNSFPHISCALHFYSEFFFFSFLRCHAINQRSRSISNNAFPLMLRSLERTPLSYGSCKLSGIQCRAE